MNRMKEKETEVSEGHWGLRHVPQLPISPFAQSSLSDDRKRNTLRVCLVLSSEYLHFISLFWQTACENSQPNGKDCYFWTSVLLHHIVSVIGKIPFVRFWTHHYSFTFSFWNWGKRSKSIFSWNLEKDIWFLSSSLKKKSVENCCLCSQKHIKQMDNGWGARVKGQFVPLQNHPAGNKARNIIEIKKWRKYIWTK